jgi:hypothetical protein
MSVPIIDIAPLFSVAGAARADATIAPLPIDAADSFKPFLFGDYLWERIVRFVEFRGMQALRSPTS